MNWLDFVLIAGLLISLIFGTKIGVVRSVMRFFALTAGIIITTNNSDIIAIEVARHIDASPMVIAIISFAILLCILYAMFRLVVLVFYKVSNVQSFAKADKIGGGFMGAVRGWVLMGFLFFLLALLPMPAGFLRMVDDSMLSEPMMRTISALYDGTKVLHPKSDTFVGKVGTSLYETNRARFDSMGEPDNSFERQKANDAVKEQMEVVQKYFGPLEPKK